LDHSILKDGATLGSPDSVRSPLRIWRIVKPAWFFWLSLAIFVIPTIIDLARGAWTEEQTAHGPLIFASGLWLIGRERRKIIGLSRPGSLPLTMIVLVPALLLFVAARVLGWLGVECLSAYAACIVLFYYHAGAAALRAMWFPLLYMVFMFPQLDTIVLPLSRLLKMGISSMAVEILSRLGYEVAQAGVVIFIDQYEILVATACSGLNSLLTLSAIGVFYVYVCYEGRWRESLPLLILIFPIAVTANFTRVFVLILVTHYFGDAVGQGFVHDFAAIFMFVVAMVALVTADTAVRAIRGRSGRQGRVTI